MKSFAKFALVIPAFLLMMNAASAAFSFQITPASSFQLIGSSQLLNIFATETTGVGVFTLGSQSISFSGDPDITFTLNMPAVNTLLVAAPGGNQIGTITANVAGTAVNFDTAAVNFTGVVNSSPGGGVALGSYTTVDPARITAIPEPSSIALVGICALAGIAVNRRRLRRKA